MSFIKSAFRHIIFSVLSILGGVTIGAGLVAAATTISTSITTAGDITTSAGNLAVTAGTLTVGGASTLTGLVTTGAGITVGTLASSTTLKVGSDQVSTISGMILGYCTIADISVVTASSTVQTTCAGATGLTSSYKVFVQATSSMPMQIVVQSATSTTGAINIRLLNTGINGGTPSAEPVSLNFWAVR